MTATARLGGGLSSGVGLIATRLTAESAAGFDRSPTRPARLSHPASTSSKLNAQTGFQPP